MFYGELHGRTTICVLFDFPYPLCIIDVILHFFADIRFCARLDIEADYSAYGAENSNAQPTGKPILSFRLFEVLSSSIMG